MKKEKYKIEPKYVSVLQSVRPVAKLTCGASQLNVGHNEYPYNATPDLLFVAENLRAQACFSADDVENLLHFHNTFDAHGVLAGHLVIFINQIGAGASVDHFHGQGVTVVVDLPIERAHLVPFLRLRYGIDILKGGSDFPLPFFCLNCSEDKQLEKMGKVAYKIAKEIQKPEATFNMVILRREDKPYILIIPRKTKGEYSKVLNANIGSLEVCGRLFTSERAVFERLTETKAEASRQLGSIISGAGFCDREMTDLDEQVTEALSIYL